MTNCPNCGAPYAPGKPVCEYCGTAREDEDGGEWIEKKNILGETFRYYEPRRLFDPSQQAACGAQALANAASCMIEGFQRGQQAAVNADFARAAYEQDIYAHKALQAQIDRNEAARSAERFTRTVFIVCVTTALTVIKGVAYADLVTPTEDETYGRHNLPKEPESGVG